MAAFIYDVAYFSSTDFIRIMPWIIYLL